ncbi:6-bladed beta-propeller [Aurantibacter crassamenti]|uniref:6-bladed beta-propeller n=1 Tax=Aurantibacter crassamenti TaxID=1837375 RepID=UPI00193A894C|nr:6-bladed beta-propeller [Aurantibacter crassamenti]MBM1106645.1 6-bladed beta-propeller [Aurantibacter crassamenti]
MKRRSFLQKSAQASSLTMAVSVLPFSIIHSKRKLEKTILGHGDFKYRVEKAWGDLDPQKHPINNCHEMVMDKKGRLLMLTDHQKNNVIIYDTSGKLLANWTLNLPGAHGLTINDEGGEEYLYITDPSQGRVIKSTLDGKVIMELKHPSKIGAYEKSDHFRPTETAIGPNGDIYIADGYGAQFILQYDADGNFIRKFGGDSFLSPEKFKQAHGVALDTRDSANPTLICSARIKNSFKRFSLEGEYIEDIYMPGLYVSRPVINDENIYSGVCFGMIEGNYNMQLNQGFVTILDKNNKVVSNPGGTAPIYKDGTLQIMHQEQPIFKHCHDVCVDNDKNLYVCQWNANKVYPYKLHRV